MVAVDVEHGNTHLARFPYHIIRGLLIRGDIDVFISDVVLLQEFLGLLAVGAGRCRIYFHTFIRHKFRLSCFSLKKWLTAALTSHPAAAPFVLLAGAAWAWLVRVLLALLFNH